MRPAFGLVQALVVSSRQEAVESLGGVVIEVVRAYPGQQVQKPLGLSQLREWIPNEGVAIHDVDLLPGEDIQPAGEVLVVQAPLQRFVPRVNVALADQKLLQGLVGLVAGQAIVKNLGVVRNQPFCWVADNEEQAHGRVHFPHTCRGLRGSKIAGGLLHCELTRQSKRHLGSVPRQASAVVLLHVEVVHLTEGGAELLTNAAFCVVNLSLRMHKC